MLSWRVRGQSLSGTTGGGEAQILKRSTRQLVFEMFRIPRPRYQVPVWRWIGLPRMETKKARRAFHQASLLSLGS